MIASIEGVLLQTGRETILAVGGGAIGLEVKLTERSIARLPGLGEQVRLWTHLVVREDAWTLYGFIDRDERTMFRLLMTVSGIGPRVALGMLSAAEPSDIAHYLHAGDEVRLARLPGIGKKSAARLVVELGQRIGAVVEEASTREPTAAARPAHRALNEALMILTAMGLQPAHAEVLVRQTSKTLPELTDDDASGLVREVLKRLETPGR